MFCIVFFNGSVWFGFLVLRLYAAWLLVLRHLLANSTDLLVKLILFFSLILRYLGDGTLPGYSTSSSSGSSNSNNNDDEKQKISRGGIAGIVIGVFFLTFCLALILVATFLNFCRADSTNSPGDQQQQQAVKSQEMVVAP